MAGNRTRPKGQIDFDWSMARAERGDGGPDIPGVGHPRAVAKNDTGVDSLCWGCLRRTWSCLCQYPEELPPGLVAVKGSESDTLRVMRCDWFWPEPELDEPMKGGDENADNSTKTQDDN